MLLTIQAYEKAKEQNKVTSFIISSFNNHLGSEYVKEAELAQEYYNGENRKIMNRSILYFNDKGLEVDRWKANEKVPSEFLKKIVNQKCSYLLGNGATFSEIYKKKLTNTFDTELLRLGRLASLEKVAFMYFYRDGDKLVGKPFSIKEFCPMYDEITGALMGGIRHWKLDDNTPDIYEVYERDYVTVYKRDKGRLVELERGYYDAKVNENGEAIASREMGVLPIAILWNNDNKTSDLTIGIKNKIDLYDIVLSDFGNNLEDNNDVYWVIKNYSGQDIGVFYEEFKKYKTLKVDGEGDASPKSFETPYQARQTALDIIRKQIYNDAMAVDTSILAGGSLTNIAIKANMIDLGLKCDEFEANLLEFMQQVFKIMEDVYGVDLSNEDVKFKRRDLINDTETITNIQTMRGDISRRTALELNPYIENVDEELERIAEEQQDNYTFDESDLNADINRVLGGESEEDGQIPQTDGQVTE